MGEQKSHFRCGWTGRNCRLGSSGGDEFTKATTDEWTRKHQRGWRKTWEGCKSVGESQENHTRVIRSMSN